MSDDPNSGFENPTKKKAAKALGASRKLVKGVAIGGGVLLGAAIGFKLGGPVGAVVGGIAGGLLGWAATK